MARKTMTLADIRRSIKSPNNLLISKTDVLIAQFSKLLDQGQFADVVFIVEGERIPAHRLVLATRSEYFRAMLFGNLSEAHKKEIELTNVSLTVFKSVLMYLYTGQLKMSLATDKVDNLLELLDLANMYRLTNLVKALSEQLFKQIHSNNAAIILNAAILYNLEELRLKCVNYFDNNASRMIKHDSIKLLSMNLFMKLIKRNSCINLEVEIFDAVLRWKQHNTEIRDIEPLISCVRFTNMTVTMLVNDVKDSGLINDAKLIEIIKEIESKPKSQPVNN